MKSENSIYKLLICKISNDELLKMFDLPCNLYYIFEYLYKNKIQDEILLKKSWEIIETNNDKILGDLYYL